MIRLSIHQIYGKVFMVGVVIIRRNKIEAKIVTCDLIMHYQILVELDQNPKPNLHTIIYNELYHSFLDEFLGQYSFSSLRDVAINKIIFYYSHISSLELE